MSLFDYDPGARLIMNGRDLGEVISTEMRTDGPYGVDVVTSPFVPEGKAFLLGHTPAASGTFDVQSVSASWEALVQRAFSLGGYAARMRREFDFSASWPRWREAPEADPFERRPPRGLRATLRWTRDAWGYNWRLHTGRLRTSRVLDGDLIRLDLYNAELTGLP